MDFGLSEEISAGAANKAPILTFISKLLEDYFREKNYGDGIKTFVIGIICVRPEVDFFFKEHRKQYKNKELTYDIKIDYKKFISSNENEIKQMLFDSIFNSLSIIEEIKVSNFNLDQFKNDLINFFEKIKRQEL